MLDKLLDLFREEDPNSGAGINHEAAAAALMFEVVWADHDIGETEMAVMATQLAELFALQPERVQALLAQATQDHEESVGLYPFTRALNDQLTADAKFEVVRALWQIAYADARIDRFEEHTIRRIAELLYVPHKQFIEAKHLARDS